MNTRIVFLQTDEKTEIYAQTMTLDKGERLCLCGETVLPVL